MKIKTAFISVLLSVCLVICVVPNVEAQANYVDYSYDYVTSRDYTYYAEPQICRVTCYCDTGYTYSGKYTRHGICAGKKEWIGMDIAVWQCSSDGTIGDFIGFFEILDTGYGIEHGGVGSIQNGTSIDIWQPTVSDCYDWVGQYGDYLYIMIIPGAKG